MDIPELRQKAESGSIVAQLVLGTCYLDGIAIAVDYKEAFRFLSAAAERGASRAMANLARMYAEGLGIPRDLPEAIRLYEKAAKAGEFLAQIGLGRAYSRGLAVTADPVTAFRWDSAAAAQEGRVNGCEELEEAKVYVKRATQEVMRVPVIHALEVFAV
jgi:uncharacterized protein